ISLCIDNNYTRKRKKQILFHYVDLTYLDTIFVHSRTLLINTRQPSKFIEHKKEIEEKITKAEKALEKINGKITDIQYQKIEILTNNDIKKIIQKKESI